MNDDKLAETRERHERADADVRIQWDRTGLRPNAYYETLLAEVERLSEVLKIVRINGPDSNGLVWVSFSREGGVRVSFVVGHEEKMVSQALLEFEQIRRKALEGKPQAAEIARLHRAHETACLDVDLLREEIVRLHTIFVLIASEEAGPVDSATCWLDDVIIGCYSSHEAADAAGKNLNVRWRIETYALEGSR